MTLHEHMPLIIAILHILFARCFICAGEAAASPLPCSISLSLCDAKECYLNDPVPVMWMIRNAFSEDVIVSIGMDGPGINELCILPSGKPFPGNFPGLTHEPSVLDIGQMHALKPGESIRKTIYLNKYVSLDHDGEHIFNWKDTFLCIYPKSNMYENLSISGSIALQVHPGSSPNIDLEISKICDEFNREGDYERQRQLFYHLYYERDPGVVPHIIRIFKDPPRSFAHGHIQLIDALDALRSSPAAERFIEDIYKSRDDDGIKCIFQELKNLRLRNEVLPPSIMKSLFTSKNPNIEMHVADYLTEILLKMNRSGIDHLIDEDKIPLNEIRSLASSDGTFLSRSIARLLHAIDPNVPLLPEIHSEPLPPPPRIIDNPQFHEDGLRLGRPDHYENKF